MPTSVTTFPSGVLCKEDNAMPKSTRKCLAAAATSVGRQGYECYRQCVLQCYSSARVLQAACSSALKCCSVVCLSLP